MNAQFAAFAGLEEEEEDFVGMSITGQSASKVIIIISIPLSSWTDRQDSRSLARSIDLSPLH